MSDCVEIAVWQREENLRVWDSVSNVARTSDIEVLHLYIVQTMAGKCTAYDLARKMTGIRSTKEASKMLDRIVALNWGEYSDQAKSKYPLFTALKITKEGYFE
ncbi:MAG: hypothetical protein ABGZ53_23275 [Fuerstiella sp.]